MERTKCWNDLSLSLRSFPSLCSLSLFFLISPLCSSIPLFLLVSSRFFLSRFVSLSVFSLPLLCLSRSFLFDWFSLFHLRLLSLFSFDLSHSSLSVHIHFPHFSVFISRPPLFSERGSTTAVSTLKSLFPICIFLSWFLVGVRNE